MEYMNRDEFLFIMYAIEELLKSGNADGALKVVQRSIKQSERKETKENAD